MDSVAEALRRFTAGDAPRACGLDNVHAPTPKAEPPPPREAGDEKKGVVFTASARISRVAGQWGFRPCSQLKCPC